MRRKPGEEMIFDSDGKLDVEGTRYCREGTPTKYDPPGENQKWRARNLITIHWKHTGITCPYPSFNAIMACVIDHANPKTGRSDPSHKCIAGDTKCHRNTVCKVLDWAEVNTPFLGVERRERSVNGRFPTHAYHPQWDALEKAWIAINAKIEAEKADRREVRDKPPRTIKGVQGHAQSRVGTVHAQSRVCSNLKALTVKKEPQHEMVRTPVRTPHDELLFGNPFFQNTQPELKQEAAPKKGFQEGKEKPFLETREGREYRKARESGKVAGEHHRKHLEERPLPPTVAKKTDPLEADWLRNKLEELEQERALSEPTPPPDLLAKIEWCREQIAKIAA
jgi:hypothetical protein